MDENESIIIASLTSVIKDQEKIEDKLMNFIKELLEENAKLRRKHWFRALWTKKTEFRDTKD